MVNIHTNDLFFNSLSSKVSAYAVDTQIFSIGLIPLWFIGTCKAIFSLFASDLIATV